MFAEDFCLELQSSESNNSLNYLASQECISLESARSQKELKRLNQEPSSY